MNSAQLSPINVLCTFADALQIKHFLLQFLEILSHLISVFILVSHTKMLYQNAHAQALVLFLWWNRCIYTCSNLGHRCRLISQLAERSHGPCEGLSWHKSRITLGGRKYDITIVEMFCQLRLSSLNQRPASCLGVSSTSKILDHGVSGYL